MKLIVLVLSALLLSLPASAAKPTNGQAKATKTLQAEPVDFMGITLGQQFDMPECLLQNQIQGFDDLDGLRKGDDYEFAHHQPVLPCWRSSLRNPDPHSRPSSTGTFEIYFYPPVNKTPEGVNENYSSMVVINNHIEIVNAGTTGYRSQEKVFLQLTAKYGKPKLISREKVQSLAGTDFTNVIANWELSGNAQLTFLGLANTIDRGGIAITSAAGAAYSADQRAKKEEKAPSF